LGAHLRACWGVGLAYIDPENGSSCFKWPFVTKMWLFVF